MKKEIPSKKLFFILLQHHIREHCKARVLEHHETICYLDSGKHAYDIGSYPSKIKGFTPVGYYNNIFMMDKLSVQDYYDSMEFCLGGFIDYAMHATEGITLTDIINIYRNRGVNKIFMNEDFSIEDAETIVKYFGGEYNSLNIIPTHLLNMNLIIDSFKQGNSQAFDFIEDILNFNGIPREVFLDYTVERYGDKRNVIKIDNSLTINDYILFLIDNNHFSKMTQIMEDILIQLDTFFNGISYDSYCISPSTFDILPLEHCLDIKTITAMYFRKTPEKIEDYLEHIEIDQITTLINNKDLMHILRYVSTKSTLCFNYLEWLNDQNKYSPKFFKIIHDRNLDLNNLKEAYDIDLQYHQAHDIMLYLTESDNDLNLLNIPYNVLTNWKYVKQLLFRNSISLPKKDICFTPHQILCIVNSIARLFKISLEIWHRDPTNFIKHVLKSSCDMLLEEYTHSLSVNKSSFIVNIMNNEHPMVNNIMFFTAKAIVLLLSVSPTIINFKRQEEYEKAQISIYCSGTSLTQSLADIDPSYYYHYSNKIERMVSRLLIRSNTLLSEKCLHAFIFKDTYFKHDPSYLLFPITSHENQILVEEDSFYGYLRRTINYGVADLVTRNKKPRYNNIALAILYTKGCNIHNVIERYNLDFNINEISYNYSVLYQHTLHNPLEDKIRDDALLIENDRLKAVYYTRL